MKTNMNIKYLTKYSANSQDIEQFELLIGSPLPHNYKQFLLTNGGGVLEKSYIFKMTTPGCLLDKEPYVEDEIETFSSFNAGGSFDLPTHFKVMNSANDEFSKIPNEMIVIGGVGGSCILLGIKGEHRGKVFFSDLFLGDETQSASYNNVCFIAGSFSAFLDSLYEDEY